MPLFEFHSIRARDYVALHDRIEALSRDSDLDAWRRLYEQLRFVHRPPHVSGHGTVIASSDPITDCSAQGWGPGPDLAPDVMPDPRSVAWILRELAIMTASHRLIGRWDKFNDAWVTWLPEAGLLETEAEREAHQNLSAVIFRSRDEYPPELAFLKHPDGANAFVTTDQIERLVEQEDRVELLQRLARRLRRHEDAVWHHLGDEMKRLELFLRLMKLAKRPMFYSELWT
jgi:hypothetical protein